MQTKQSIFRAFTLVELIVVITIIGILSTVGFVSYSGYLTGARDSNRISQLTKLSDALQVYSASKTLPLPDNSIDITASWALIAYQWEVWVDVLETIDYTNGGKDPKDDTYYTYYLTKDRKSLQLMAMMEEAQSVANLNNIDRNIYQAQANFEERFPKVYGRKLWVLTYLDDSNPTQLNTPANLIAENAGWLDILDTSWVSYTSHISDDEKIEGADSTLSVVNPQASCKRIKQTGWARSNGIYTISPVWEDFQVYCDMETAWGGWTMGARSSTAGWDMFSLSVNSLYPYTDYGNAYSIDISDITYTNAMLVSFTNNISNITNTLQDNLTETSMEIWSYTLNPDGIIGGSANDWFNLEQWAIFLK